MGLKLYNTYQRSKVEFKPITRGEVKLYTCGPTVYTDAHIGNFRTYIFEDLLRRTLKFLGYNVTQVMNLTDVDDKTIKASQEKGISLSEHTAPIIARFFNDLDTLNIERAEYYPAATEHIPEMITIVNTLLEKGHAYIADGSVYFSIESFPGYGKLSGMNLEMLARGVRIDADEYEKDNFRDFALWRGWTKADGDVRWHAPFGDGRPGWHIECSAMSMKYLGEDFDIHTGGVDNIFPHHENEIAQSVCATGSQFAKYWLHSAHLVIDAEKMSKSLGNTFVLQDLLKRGYSARVLRYVLLTTHYRQRLNFTDEVVQSAEASLERLDTLRHAALEVSGEGAAHSQVTQAVKSSLDEFKTALEDDLGISRAMAALFELISTIHRIRDERGLNAADGRLILSQWGAVDRVLGFLFPYQAELDEKIAEKVKNRISARREKNFDLADKIRDELARLGYQLEDTREGTAVIWAEGRIVVKI